MSFSGKELIEAVRQGRKNEFNDFGWKGDPIDPYDLHAFEQCKLNWDVLDTPVHKILRFFYQYIIALRKSMPALSCGYGDFLEAKAMEEEKMFLVTRRYKESEIKILMNFNHQAKPFLWPHTNMPWKLVLDSSDQRWSGPGRTLPDSLHDKEKLSINPLSCVCYERSS